jgi:hypothetical protein
MATLVVPQVVHAQSGAQQIIKQRAKDLRDQNNARQGVAPPASGPSATSTSQQPVAAVPAQPLTPQQQALARLQASLSAMRPGTTVTPEMKQQLTRDLIGVSHGTPKPSSPAATRLSEDLATALSQKLLANVTRSRLTKNLSALLNPAATQASQVPDIVADIQSIFESNGVPAQDARRAAESAKAAAEELRKPANK